MHVTFGSVLIGLVMFGPWCAAEGSFDDAPEATPSAKEAVQLAKVARQRRIAVQAATAAGAAAPPAPASVAPVPPPAPSGPRPPDLDPEDARRQLHEQVRMPQATALQRAILDGESTAVEVSDCASAFAKLQTFFETLGEIFFERAEVLDILKRALVAEGSVLILGPGGTAKSDLADHIGNNLVESREIPDSTSYYTLQLTQDTTAGETHGGMIMEKALEGRMIRNWEAGILGAKFAFLDEFFDARLKFLRGFLKAFNERKYTQGTEVFKGKLKFFVAASNKYLNQIYETFGSNEPQALIDRFLYTYFAPGILRNTQSILDLDKERPPMPQLTFAELEQLNQAALTIKLSALDKLRAQHIFSSLRRILMARQDLEMTEYQKARKRGELVQPPYRATRIFSPRSLATAFKLIKVETLLRALAEGRPAQVLPGDIDRALSKFLIMQGPRAKDLIESPTSDPYERAQIHTLRIEQDALDEVMTNLTRVERDEYARTTRNLDAVNRDPGGPAAWVDLETTVGQCQLLLDGVDDAERIDARTIAVFSNLRRIREATRAPRTP